LRILKKETSSLLLRQAIFAAQENLSILMQEKEDVLKSEEDRLLAMDKDVLARVTFMEEFLEALAVSWEGEGKRKRESNNILAKVYFESRTRGA
jgi:hypothetical protein